MAQGIENYIIKGVKAFDEGHFKAAESALKIALKLAKGQPKKEAFCLLKLAMLALSRKRYSEAIRRLDLCQKARDSAGLGEDIDWARIQYCLGNVHYRNQSFLEAAQCFRNALRVGEKDASFEELPDIVYSLALILLQLESVDEAIPLMESHIKKSQRFDTGEVRELLTIALRKSEQKQVKRALIKSVLAKETKELLENPCTPPHRVEVPSAWGADRFTEFLQLSENNLVSSVSLGGNSFGILKELDARFRVSYPKLREYVMERMFYRSQADNTAEKSVVISDWIEAFFFARCHSSFWGAAQLGLSGLIPESFMVLRGSLENAMYAFRVYTSPELVTVWVKRNESPSDLKRCKDKFSIKNIGESMATRYSKLSEDCAAVYDYLIEEGAHPNPAVFASHAESTRTEQGDHILRVSYLHPERVDLFLETAQKVGDISLRIFAELFPDQVA